MKHALTLADLRALLPALAYGQTDLGNNVTATVVVNPTSVVGAGPFTITTTITLRNYNKGGKKYSLWDVLLRLLGKETRVPGTVEQTALGAVDCTAVLPLPDETALVPGSVKVNGIVQPDPAVVGQVMLILVSLPPGTGAGPSTTKVEYQALLSPTPITVTVMPNIAWLRWGGGAAVAKALVSVTP